MQIRDRIQKLVRVPARELRPHPRNWRVHPNAQQDALRGVLAEVGFVDALLARELSDGTLELIDGHLRAETAPDSEVPVLVVDLDDAETSKVLATFDPLGSLAVPDGELLDELLRDVRTDCPALQQLLEEMVTDPLQHATEEAEQTPRADKAPATRERFQVLIDCADEAEQIELLQELNVRNLKCRALIA